MDGETQHRPDIESHHNAGSMNHTVTMMSHEQSVLFNDSHDMSQGMSHDMLHNMSHDEMHSFHDDMASHGIHNGNHDTHDIGEHEMHDLAALLNFGNSSSPAPCQGAECVVEQVIVVTLPFLIIFGNIITIFVLAKTKAFRNCHGYFLLSLAVADLLMGPVSLLAIFPMFMNFWPFGVTVCFLSAYIGEVCMKVSLLMLLLLSIERYIAICHPFYYTRLVTKRRTLCLITLCWVFCNLLYIVTLPTELICFTFETDKRMCTVTYFLHPEYVIGIILTFMAPSMVVVTFTTARCSYQIFQSQVRDRNSEGKGTKGKGTKGKSPYCEMRVHSKKNVRVFKVLIVVLLAFYSCWLPYVVIHIYAYLDGNSWDLNHEVEFFSYWLAVTNSCLNPMIYFGMNKTFKRSAVLLLRKFFSRITCRQLKSSSEIKESTSSQLAVISATSAMTLNPNMTEMASNGCENKAFQESMD